MGKESKHTQTSATVMARLEQRRNEDLVLAESSLLGERRVTWVRLVMLALFASTQAIAAASGHAPPMILARGLVIGLYLCLAIGAAVALTWYQVPNPRRARVMPVFATVVDFGFLTSMATLDYVQEGRVFPEMGAISFALVLCFSVARYSWWHVLISTVMAIGCYLGIGLATGRVSGSTPFVLGGFAALGLLIGLTNRSVRNMFTGLRRRDNLTRFLPRAVAEHILAGGDGALAPVQREVTVLFSDIRDFTSFSEALPPRQVLEFLDEYFGHMAQIVKGHDGVVNKFLGDGMLAFWGVPDRMPDHAERAIAAALDMRRTLEEFNQIRANRGEPPIRIGVGVHTGTVAAGMLGGADQHEYTVIGDAVNVAARVEGLTKTLGVDILISETTWRLCEGRFLADRLTEETIRGRKDPVVVYSIRGRS